MIRGRLGLPGAFACTGPHHVTNIMVASEELVVSRNTFVARKNLFEPEDVSQDLDRRLPVTIRQCTVDGSAD
jgi:hypothetical protein